MPLTVAILSDTHGQLDPRIAERVADADYAVHAGDIGAAAVLGALKPRREVIAVRGNNDVPNKWPAGEGSIIESLPLSAELSLPGGTLVVLHGHRTPASGRHERLRRAHPEARAIVYGHSHRLVCDLDAHPWVLNPGAAGRARTFGGPSCILLHIDGHDWYPETVRYTEGSRKV